jgi:hypothetical protein
MREPTAAPGPRRRTGRLRLAGVLLGLAALTLVGCSDDSEEPAGEAAETPASSESASESPTESPSEVESPDPSKPEEPAFGTGAKAQRAFVTYIVDGWSYSLVTNDASVLLDASGKKPCRGCDSLQAELKQREKEGWYVDFPGAEVKKVTFGSRGDIREATAVVDVPESRSFFDDGTFRNDNKAHDKARFLIDIEAVGSGKKRHWELVAFSVK